MECQSDCYSVPMTQGTSVRTPMRIATGNVGLRMQVELAHDRHARLRNRHKKRFSDYFDPNMETNLKVVPCGM